MSDSPLDLTQFSAIAEQTIWLNRSYLVLEPWQKELLDCDDFNVIYNKSRQVGFSWIVALRGLMRAMYLDPNSYTNVFVSINRDEAKEKIRYCLQFHDAIPKHCRIELKSSSKLELEFVNGNRIVSSPSKAVRGKTNVDLVLDEFAHIQEAQKIYEGSTPATVRGAYGITIGSTPYGRGMFNSIFQGAGESDSPYKQFLRKEIPWWLSSNLCKDVLRASIEAPAMTTEERVRKFGTERLVREFESQMREVFQQEYECKFWDYVGSVLSDELILRQSNGELETESLDLDCSDSHLAVAELVKILIDNVRSHGIEEAFIGYDVGREVNASEVTVLALKEKKLYTAAYITMRKAEFPTQEAVLRQLMDKLPIKKAVIDNQAIGMQMGETLERAYGSKVYRMTFSVTSKEQMVSGLVKAFESGTLWIYPTRHLLHQLLAVKKVSSESGKILYKSESQREDGYSSHADAFWALAMGVYGANQYINGHIQTTTRSAILRGAQSPWRRELPFHWGRRL